jgi:MoaA/NifB/PqqE/SkfB family radical SAM enzyme
MRVRHKRRGSQLWRRNDRGIRHCRAVGQKVGLRLTLTPHSFHNLGMIFDFIVEEEIERACFYHLVPAWRGRDEMSLRTRKAGMPSRQSWSARVKWLLPAIHARS